MKAGDLIWLVERNWRGPLREPEQVAIDKVGVKYFYIGRDKYEIGTLRHVTETNYQNLLYADIQQYRDEQEHSKLSSEIRTHFQNWGRIGLTLEQLRAIKNIIYPKRDLT